MLSYHNTIRIALLPVLFCTFLHELRDSPYPMLYLCLCYTNTILLGYYSTRILSYPIVILSYLDTLLFTYYPIRILSYSDTILFGYYPIKMLSEVYKCIRKRCSKSITYILTLTLSYP